MNGELKRYWKEAVVAHRRRDLGIHVQGLRRGKPFKNSDFYQAPSEYKSRVVPPHQPFGHRARRTENSPWYIIHTGSQKLVIRLYPELARLEFRICLLNSKLIHR